MINNDPKPISVHQLIAEIKEYLELQRETYNSYFRFSCFDDKYHSWGRSSFLFAFCFGLFIGAGYWSDRSFRYYRLCLPIDIGCSCFVEETAYN